MNLFLGVDIGGSHIGIGLLNHECQVVAETSVDIDKDATPEFVVDSIFNACNQMLENVDGDVLSIGIGCPGASKDGVLIAASNLPLFKNVPLADMVSAKFNHIPAVLLNDANAALSAELRSAEGRIEYKGVRFAAIITIGTGIGVSLFLNGSFYEGCSNTIEAGHMIVASHPAAPKCPCGQIGCAEMYCSASNTARRMKELDEVILTHGAAADDCNQEVPTSELIKLSHEGGAKAVFDRAELGDSLADHILDETAKYIAILCINLCRVLDLEVIIIGGGMAQAGDTLLSRVQAKVQEHTWTVLPTNVRVCLAKCMKHTGMIGAALAGKELISDIAEDSEDGMVDGGYLDNHEAQLGQNEGYAESEGNGVSELGLTAVSDNVENQSVKSWGSDELKYLSDLGAVAAENNSLIVASGAGLSITLISALGIMTCVSLKIIEPKPNSLLSSISNVVFDTITEFGGAKSLLISLLATQGIVFAGQLGIAWNVYLRTQNWRKL